MATAEIKRHWSLVAELGCVVCRSTDVTLHHAHGGSMIGIAGRGVGQKTSDWLVIPLSVRYHTGEYGIDLGMGRFTTVDEWERAFGSQMYHLYWVSWQLCYSVFARAGINHPVPPEPPGLLRA